MSLDAESLKSNHHLTITTIPSPNPEAQNNRTHHVGGDIKTGIPPTSFRNPWPSAVSHITFPVLFNAKFLRSEDRNNVPLPVNREGLVKVRKPDWGVDHPERMKVTWIGHASFLVETGTTSTVTSTGIEKGRSTNSRGVRILLDPVFSERMSPVSWFGPKRYTPVPCTIEEVPEVDIIAISHNHYDHLDTWTIKEVWRITKAQGRRLAILCGLGNKALFSGLLPDMRSEDILELDWWDAREISVPGVGTVQMTCTPAQHGSKRGVNDADKTLWCSWIIREVDTTGKTTPKCLFFAGDTGYRHVNSHHPTPEEEASMPRCPAFKEIGERCGPFDLALLSIGLYSPRDLLSTVHCAPEDSVCIHKDIGSKRSIGMHWGTMRGGLSGAYEDVLEPPRRWKSECEKAGLKWGEEAGLCEIGETVLV